MLDPIEQFWSVCKSKPKKEHLLKEDALTCRVADAYNIFFLVATFKAFSDLKIFLVRDFYNKMCMSGVLIKHSFCFCFCFCFKSVSGMDFLRAQGLFYFKSFKCHQEGRKRLDILDCKNKRGKESVKYRKQWL